LGRDRLAQRDARLDKEATARLRQREFIAPDLRFSHDRLSEPPKVPSSTVLPAIAQR
jgi:hypothetical protein